jgi:hypothetical protein
MGEAGDGTTTASRTTPVQTSVLDAATQVAAGTNHVFAWDLSGALSAWGSNSYGQLGDGSTQQRKTPVSIPGFLDVVVARGAYHSIAAKADGSAWAWGQNTYGQVGNNNPGTSPSSPVQLTSLDSVVSVAAGQYFSIAVSSDGRVWTWGNNSSQQLGDGTTVQRNAPVQISDAGFLWHVATPSFNLASGTYNTDRAVTLTCATPGAAIHYRMDGVDPTEADPAITSGGIVNITATTTLKAKAWLAGRPPSNLNTAVYTMVVGTPWASPGGGTYSSAVTVTMSSATSGADIRYTIDGTTPSTSSPRYSGAFVINTRTTLKMTAFRDGWSPSWTATAEYYFNYGTLGAPVFSPAPAQVGYGTQLVLSAMPGAAIRYTTNGTTPSSYSPVYTAPIPITGTVTIYAKAFHPDWTTSLQSGGTYTVKVGAPVFSPSGGTYAAGQLITVNDTTPSATIHYTTNGVDPTEADPTIASGDTVVAGDYGLKARAFVSGWTSSDITGATYSTTGQLAAW